MVAANHDRRLQFAAGDHLIEGEAEPMPVTKADPADSRRKSLKRDALARHVEPVMQRGIVGHELLHLLIGAIDILRVARQRGAAERTDAAAKQRPDIGRHEPRKIEGILYALLERHLSYVVAVIDDGDA